MSRIPSNKRRNQRIADRALKPWVEHQRSTGDPDFYSRTSDQWLGDQAAMMSDIDDRLYRFNYVNPNSAVMQRMAGEISSDYGIEFDEAIRNMIRTAQLRGNGPVLSNAVNYAYPAAAADERMGVAALNISGYDDPRLLNAGQVHATDLQADKNGRTYNIDSQKIVNTNDTLSIGALQNVESSVPIYRMLEGQSAKSVLENLQMLQKASRRASDGRLTSQGFDISGAENKLMQSSTSRFNPNPSELYQRDEELLRKDGLLVTDHSDYIAPRSEFRAGSYDPRKPAGMSLVDMEALRDVLSVITLEDLQRAGGSIGTHGVSQSRRHLASDARQRGNRLSDVSLVLPKSVLQGSSGSMAPINAEALALLTQSLS